MRENALNWDRAKKLENDKRKRLGGLCFVYYLKK